MRRLSTWLMTIRSPDEDVQRRGRMLVVLTLGLIALSLLLLPATATAEEPLAALILIGVSFICYAIVLVLARYGYVTAGGLLIIALTTLGTLLSSGNSIQAFNSLYFLILSLQVASLVLRPVQIWIVLAVVLAGVTIKALLAPSAPLAEPMGQAIVFSVMLLLTLVALVGFLSSRATVRALAEVRAARVAAESAAAELGRANADLETRVGDRTNALQSALAEVEQRAAEQARLLEENQQQREAIRDLSVPVLPIDTATLVMPLVGTLDSQRLALAQEQALGAIERARARYLALDITGVPLVDSQVAQGLVGVVQAAQLLGTEVVLVGVRPEVAQAIVGLGIDLRGIQTFRDLQSAIEQIVYRRED
ncbi:MAG TPA: STAS domain-containing protein [Roseiflexaceae bacterium]|nr:STAS domain-containing protein [Roseiflexaceae bacterium]